jgi:hypothetical protein
MLTLLMMEVRFAERTRHGVERGTLFATAPGLEGEADRPQAPINRSRALAGSQASSGYYEVVKVGPACWLLLLKDGGTGYRDGGSAGKPSLLMHGLLKAGR